MMSSGDAQDGMYYLRDRNRVSGPFDVDTLRRFAQGKRLARHHQLSTDRMTWLRAADVLPEVFTVAVRPPERKGAEPGPIIDGDPPPEPIPPPIGPDGPDVGTHPPMKGMPWERILVGLAGMCCLAVAGVFVWLMLGLVGGTWSASRIQRELAPKLTVVRGSRPDGRKASCFGVVVSRLHVVAPLAAASFRAPKVDTVTDEGDSDWHSASLVLVDPHAKLAVLRADLGEAVDAMTLSEDRRLPTRQDDLYLVAPDRKDYEGPCPAELDEVLERGEPDETLMLSFKDDPPPDDEIVGRAVIDEEGRFVGLVVGVGPDGRAMCTASNEVRIKRSEAKKLPQDHALEPLDIGDPPSGTARDRRDAPRESETPRGPDESPEVPGPSGSDTPPTPPPSETPEPDREPQREETPTNDDLRQDDPPAADRGKKAGVGRRSAPPKGAVATLGEAGAEVVSDVTDAMTPRLSSDRADELGRNHLESILREHPACRDRRLNAKVQRLCAEVLKAADEDRKAYTITVVEDSEVNAYAFVGRNLVVTTGFLEFAGSDDDMIRFVMAHEVGHVVLGHTDEPFRRIEAARELVPGGELAANFAQSVFKNSPMNQSQERAADCFAVRCVRRAGHSVDGGVRFFKKLDSEVEGNASEGTVGALFSSHPDTPARIEHISSGCD